MSHLTIDTKWQISFIARDLPLPVNLVLLKTIILLTSVDFGKAGLKIPFNLGQSHYR